MLFFIYQTARHGPQNGFRLCLVHAGFRIGSEEEDEEGEGVEGEGEGEGDEIDWLEREIPQGCMGVVVLGPKTEPEPGEGG